MNEVGAGKPVAIVPDGKGVLAISSDGARRRYLTSTPCSWVFVDNRSRVVWLQRRLGATSELWLVDLTQRTPTPERVLEGLSAGAIVAVAYAGDTRRSVEMVRTSASEYGGRIELWLSTTRPETKYERGIYEMIFEDIPEIGERAESGRKIVDSAVPRLRELAARGQGRSLLLRSEAPSSENVPRVAAVARARCNATHLCGAAERIAATRWMRVAVEHSCGDACHVRWQLYDTRTREFVDHRTGRRSAKPIDRGNPASMNDAFVSRNGEGFVIDGNVYALGGRRVFAGKGKGGGWLGGQWYLGPR